MNMNEYLTSNYFVKKIWNFSFYPQKHSSSLVFLYLSEKLPLVTSLKKFLTLPATKLLIQSVLPKISNLSFRSLDGPQAQMTLVHPLHVHVALPDVGEEPDVEDKLNVEHFHKTIIPNTCKYTHFSSFIFHNNL